MPIIGGLPFTLTNGTLADADQVMGNFDFIVQQVNANSVGSTDWTKIQVKKTNLQTFGTTPTLVTWQFTDFDPTVEWDGTGNQMRVVNPGYYWISVQMQFDTLAGANVPTTLLVYKNGVVTNIFTNTITPNTVYLWSPTPIGAAIQLDANDTIQIYASNVTAGGVTTDAAGGNILTIFRFG